MVDIQIKNKPKVDKSIIITGIICLTFLEAYALHHGINGVVLSMVLCIIACAIGVAIPKEMIK